jgi:hypothetical protein
MSSFSLGLGVAVLAPLVGARLLFLVRWRAGWVTYLCCVAGETIQKRTGLSRNRVELAQAVAGLGLLGLAGLGAQGLASIAAVLACLEVSIRVWDGRILREVFARPVRPPARNRRPGDTFTCLDPSVDPDLTVTIAGPFVERTPHLQLGHLWVGREVEFHLSVANHTRISTQTPIELRVEDDGGLAIEPAREALLPRLRPGEVGGWRLRARPAAPGGPGTLRLRLLWGDRIQEVQVHHLGAGDRPTGGLRDARISRYAGGCRAAFAWRGDMDLYDEVTLQSVEGLEETLALAARYRMPQTLYLSTRLSLDAAEAGAYAERFGVDRGAERIPDFVRWIGENVELRHVSPYPFESEKRFLLELGNHGHLHFGTDAAAAPANGWRLRTKLGGGRYPWLGQDTGSFAEQRDNALEAARQCQEAFGFVPRSWAMPDRTRDSETPRAMEAAGCEVLSDSDVRTIHNVLLQPPPHHPAGTRAVELTKRYPGDPLDVYHVAMNVFWFHRAHRLGIPVVFMCHQHLRAYESRSCAVYTEYLLRYVLERFNGDLHVNTVFGIGKYWREVLSPETRTVTVRVNGDEVIVTNGSDQDFDAVPVDLVTADGRHFTRLVSLAAGAEVRLNAFA